MAEYQQVYQVILRVKSVFMIAWCSLMKTLHTVITVSLFHSKMTGILLMGSKNTKTKQCLCPRYCFYLKCLDGFPTGSVDPDQVAASEAVWSVSPQDSVHVFTQSVWTDAQENNVQINLLVLEQFGADFSDIVLFEVFRCPRKQCRPRSVCLFWNSLIRISTVSHFICTFLYIINPCPAEPGYTLPLQIV